MLELFPSFLVLSAPMFGASNLHSLRNACLHSRRRQNGIPWGPAVGCQRPAYLNRLLCTLLPFLYGYHLSIDDGSVWKCYYYYYSYYSYYYRLHGILCFYASVSGVQPSISPTASLQSTPYIITLSLLGHWLLPRFTPQLCMTPHDIGAVKCLILIWQ